jgi:uncharacterized membrane protein
LVRFLRLVGWSLRLVGWFLRLVGWFLRLVRLRDIHGCSRWDEEPFASALKLEDFLF